MPKSVLSLLGALAVVTITAGASGAASSATAMLGFSPARGPVAALSLDPPQPARGAVAPGEPRGAAAAYGLTSSDRGRKLVGHLTAAPAGDLILRGHFAAPPDSGGTDCGWVRLSTTPVDLVTGIGPVCARKVPVQIELLGASAAAGAPASTTLILTLMGD